MTDLRRAAQAMVDFWDDENTTGFCDVLEALRAALAQQDEPSVPYEYVGDGVVRRRGQSDDGWIACETRMPERFETVVVIGPDGPPAAGYWTGEEWWVPLTDDEIVGVTHWMAIPLLPKPPAQEDTK
jgi:hypothetical protein